MADSADPQLLSWTHRKMGAAQLTMGYCLTFFVQFKALVVKVTPTFPAVSAHSPRTFSRPAPSARLPPAEL